MWLYKVLISLLESALCYLGMMVFRKFDLILETNAKNNLKFKLHCMCQILIKAFVVHGPLGTGSSCPWWLGREQPPAGGLVHQHLSQNTHKHFWVYLLHIPVCCLLHSLEALSWSRVLVSALQSCQDMMPTAAGFSLSEAVCSHKLRIIHTLSNRARQYMGGWLEYDMLPFPFSGICPMLHAVSFM